MPPTIAAVPKFVSGAQTYTPPQPTVAVPAPLGTTANRHRHSKPILGYHGNNPPEPHYHNRIDSTATLGCCGKFWHERCRWSRFDFGPANDGNTEELSSMSSL
eukprot:scaffold46095_cov70-Attheya_sp.AAC.9